VPATPKWFKGATNSVLDGCEALATAQGPREIEEITATLLGAELDRVLQSVTTGLFFDRWFVNVVEAVAARTKMANSAQNDHDEGPWRLLRGLSSLATPDAGGAVRIALSRAEKWRRNQSEPAWLSGLGEIAATGEVWELRDGYGTRFGIIANFAYPDGVDPTAFLWDVDASGFVAIAHAGVYDDVEQAAGAWRELVGDTATDAQLQQVEEHSVGLAALAGCVRLGHNVMGDESRNVLDNWFRAHRRIADLDHALDLAGRSMVNEDSLVAEPNIELMTTPFVDWYQLRFGVKPSPIAVEDLAVEWTADIAPETWFSVSPQRVKHLLSLLSVWAPDDLATIEVTLLLPKWVRWLGERSELPSELVERVVTEAGKPYVAE
jgi:hypothetical protein